MSEYSKGDYTKCYEDICEVWFEDNLYCIVRTDDADKIVDVLNENSELKRNFVFKDNLIRDLKYSMNRLSDENEQLKHDASVLVQSNKDYRIENEQLKQQIKKLEAQLYKVEDGVCDICNNMYLVQQGRFFISKCKKGHDECSKMDLDYCDDFELKGDVE